MNKEPLLSSAVLNCLRNLALEPCAKRGSIARERLAASASSAKPLFPIGCARPLGAKRAFL